MIKVKTEIELLEERLKKAFNALPTTKEASKTMLLNIKNSGISLKENNERKKLQ